MAVDREIRFLALFWNKPKNNDRKKTFCYRGERGGGGELKMPDIEIYNNDKEALF